MTTLDLGILNANAACNASPYNQTLREETREETQLPRGNWGLFTAKFISRFHRIVEYPISLTFCHHATSAKNEKKREKKVKTDDRVECFVCHSVVIRIDRHLRQTQSDIFHRRQLRFYLAFYRCRNAKSQRRTIYDCRKCITRFGSLVTHKKVNNCDCSTVVKVPNPESRSSLPAEIRVVEKSSCLPAARDLDIAERVVEFQTDISRCGGENRK